MPTISKALQDAVWPVGSVLITVVSTNPGTLLGFGTWSAFGAGKFLVGLDGGDSDFDTAEETGGTKTVTLTEGQMPAHTHTPQVATGAGIVTAISTTPLASGVAAGPHATDSKGGGAAHNNLPPYIVVYMWKRTA